jgi:hypothetical protein
MVDDPELPPVFTRDEALRAGLSPHQVAHRVRTGRWRRLRRNVYSCSSLYDVLPTRQQHALAVIATMLTRPETEVASHLSAAVIYGCTTPLDGPGPVTLTSGDHDRSTFRTPRLLLQVASLPAQDVTLRRVTIRGHTRQVRLTTPPRTVADNLRHLRHPDGVALADAALRSGLVSFEAVAAVLERQAAWPYGTRGLTALPLLDRRRESWLESYSFVRLHEVDLALPEPQVTILDRRGRLLGRVDGWIADSAVALEADGREKYLMPSTQHRDLDRAADDLEKRALRRLREEKDREDGLRDVGVQFARWGTHDIVHSVDEVRHRVEAACARGDVSGFTGRTSYQPAPPWLATRPAQPGHASVPQNGFDAPNRPGKRFG